MLREYNYQAFTPDEVESGLSQDLINYLLDHNKKNKNQYYDIHITSDGHCTIIEWTDVSYDHKYGDDAKFGFIPSDGCVMIERSFPDGHIEMCFDEEDYNERMKAFLEEHPGWVKTSYGTWTNEIENEKWRKALEDQSKGKGNK